MRFGFLLALILLVVPAALADGLPELGDVAQSSFSPLQERQLGESIMRDIRADPSYYDDAEATDYLNGVGDRLVSRGTDVRQPFEFFLIEDNQINAFALPGGFVGVNTGLLLAAQSESEMTSVLAHEIAHVTQHHIARLIARQKRSMAMSLASLAIAILAARSNSQVAEAAIIGGQAGAVQSQLNFTRSNEQEADRIGLQILERAGFDSHAMPIFFERLQRASRLYEGGAPSYLRTHPLTFERIAEIQNRIQNLPYRQIPDSLEFQLIRAKLKAGFDSPRDALAFFQDSLGERKFLSEAASRYGLVVSLLRNKDYPRAKKEFEALRRLGRASPIIETLACRVKVEAGETESALACYRDALKTYPNYRALTYDYADALLKNRQPQAALKLVEGRLQYVTEDYRFYLLQARSYAMLGKSLAQHRAQAEAYARLGNIPGAVEQLQIAVKSGDGDFYQLSATEARLRELRRKNEELRKEEAQR
jgi:predicted Zn-dependent protease